jgi:hypothetical protein
MNKGFVMMLKALGVSIEPAQLEALFEQVKNAVPELIHYAHEKLETIDKRMERIEQRLEAMDKPRDSWHESFDASHEKVGSNNVQRS